jgi:hypothetical protein
MNPDTLNAIATQVQRIAQAVIPKPQTLGFGRGPKQVRYVYCNRQDAWGWHFKDEQHNPISIEHEALTGYVRCLEFKAAIDQGEKVFNLHCTLEADALYVLVSESTAHFSKALLSAIAQLPLSQLQQPLTIVPQVVTLGDEVLSCEVYQGNRLLCAPYDEMTNWKEVSKTAVNAVKLAQEDELPQRIQA